MKKKWIIIGVIVLVIGLIGFNIWKTQATTILAVETASLEEETMMESVMTPGILQLNEEQFVYFQAEKGEVAEIFVQAGDVVKKGDQLLRYENKQLELDKKQNQLQINSIHLELDKLKKQHADIDKAIEKEPEQDMLEEEHDQIKMQQQLTNIELEQALLQKESIENQIEELVVTANVDGTVLTVDEQAGVQGQMSEQSIIRIGSLDDVVVTGAISEYDTLHIEKGQDVTLTSDAVPDKEWQGKVSYIGDLPKESALGSGQEDISVDYPIEVTLEESIDLKPGFKMLINIITSEQTVNTLPISCVIQEGETNVVFVVKDGKATRVEVTIGTVDTEKMEIIEGVTKEDKVIVDPADTITDGMEVTVQ